MPRIDEEQLAVLERFLGRDVRSEEESCNGFAALTESNLQDIARLAHGGSTISATLYVRFLIGREASLRNAMTFVDRVVCNGVQMDDWLKNYLHQE